MKAPVSKIKQLRYEAGLKYGGRVADQAQARLLAALSRAILEIESKKICLVIEDALAKNWLQSQLKSNGLIFDHSFNSEIVKVDAEGFFRVLRQFFDPSLIKGFEEAFEKLQKEKKGEKLREGFMKLTKDFASGAAKTAGGAVATYFGIFAGISG